MSVNSPSRATKFEIKVLLIIIALGVFLFFFGMGTESIWLDEAHSVYVAHLDLSTLIHEAADGSHPPLYFIILHFWIAVFGTSEFALRALSAVFGVLSIILIYFTGTTLFKRKIGLMSSFLCAISPMVIRYAQDARPYTLLLFLSLVSFLFFIKILKHNRRWYYPVYFIANVLLAYTHVYGLFLIATQVFFFVLFWTKHKRQRLSFFITQLVTLAALVPLILILGIATKSAIQSGLWIPEPSIIDVCKTIGAFAGGYVPLIVFILLAALAPFIISKINSNWTWKNPLESIEGSNWIIKVDAAYSTILLLIWFFFSIIVAFLISRITTPIYLNRYLIGVAPALLLLVAKGLSRINTKLLSNILLVIILLGTMPFLVNHYLKAENEQWREVARLVESTQREDDVILIAASYYEMPFDYYYKGGLKIIGLDRMADYRDQETYDLINSSLNGKERVWLILAYMDPESSIEDYLTLQFGEDSILVNKQFIGIRVLLFDMSGQRADAN